MRTQPFFIIICQLLCMCTIYIHTAWLLLAVWMPFFILYCFCTIKLRHCCIASVALSCHCPEKKFVSPVQPTDIKKEWKEKEGVSCRLAYASMHVWTLSPATFFSTHQLSYPYLFCPVNYFDVAAMHIPILWINWFASVFYNKISWSGCWICGSVTYYALTCIGSSQQ